MLDNVREMVEKCKIIIYNYSIRLDDRREVMIKSKKQMFLVIGVFALMLFVGGITYAFFNYTRTGAGNTIRVGRIAFISRQTETINLTNLFPIDPTNSEEMSDATKVGTLEIEIEGDTDYSGGIEYLVSSVDSNVTTSSGKTIPLSLDVTITGLGTESLSYWETRENTNASIYKRLVGDTLKGDEQLLVGFIKPNTTSGTQEGIDGKITIKAYLDKNKILISDTYDGTESDNMGTPNSMAQGKTVLTTAEWNALQNTAVSFKVKVEANQGIWVEEIRTLYGIMQDASVMDNVSSTYVSASSGIDFGAVSSDTNGKGVYERAGTQNDEYPIYYYRGAVDNNNVVFANKCWKAVRTTDTGGVKLIYNGNVSAFKAPISQSDYGTPVTNNGFTFDTSDNSWNATMTTNLTSSDAYEISFNVPAGDGYMLQISGVPTTVGGVTVGVYKGGSQVNGTGGGSGAPFQLSHTFGTLTASDTIKVTYYMSGGNSTSENPSTIKVQMVKPDETLGTGCNNTGGDTHISLDVSGTPTNMFAFNTSYNSPAYVGYMYGDVYAYSTSNWTSGARFGSSFTWNGTNYTLVDDTVTSPNATHHYSCNVTTESGTCTDLRYVYYVNGSTKYYITLTGGDGIEEALTKMQTNTNDSNAKEEIDTWYASNLAAYTNKLEDTIWCNDRSVGDNNNNGWIANGGDLNTYLYYGAYQRSNYASNTSTVKNGPSLACTNKNDAFTVSNGNGNQKLIYPVALLTEDEMVLAGGLAGSSSTFYLNNGNYYWSLSPIGFSVTSADEFRVSSGNLYNSTVDGANGLRPAVSLKPGTPVISGDGTVTSPYIIVS